MGRDSAEPHPSPPTTRGVKHPRIGVKRKRDTVKSVAYLKNPYDRWAVALTMAEGNPRIILFDTGNRHSRLYGWNGWNGGVWNVAIIPTSANGHGTSEAVVSSYVVACPSEM